MCLNVITKGGAALLALALAVTAGCGGTNVNEGSVVEVKTNPCRLVVTGSNEASFATEANATETWEVPEQACGRVEVDDWVEQEGDGGIDLQLGGSHDD